jgi:hypothetical protein
MEGEKGNISFPTLPPQSFSSFLHTALISGHGGLLTPHVTSPWEQPQLHGAAFHILEEEGGGGPRGMHLLRPYKLQDHWNIWTLLPLFPCHPWQEGSVQFSQMRGSAPWTETKPLLISVLSCKPS